MLKPAMEFTPRDAVLVMMSHAKLGDFLLLTPHLQKIQNLYPRVSVAVPDSLYDLYQEKKIFREGGGNFTHTLDLTYPLLMNVRVPAEHFRLQPRHFLSPRHVFKSYGESLTEYFPRYRNEENKPMPFIELDASPSVLARHGLAPFRYFTVHSGSDYAPKNWAPADFEQTIRKLLQGYPEITCVSLVGPQDEELFGGHKPERFITVKAPLAEVAQLMAGSLFHIDNDSGVHHLAGALDVPSITVFGPTAPGTWSSSARFNYVHWGGPGCADHCGGARMQTCAERICLSSVRPEALALSAQKILANYEGF